MATSLPKQIGSPPANLQDMLAAGMVRVAADGIALIDSLNNVVGGINPVATRLTPTTISVSGATVLSAASMLSGSLTRSGTQNADFTDTTDTAANIIDTVVNFSIGQAYRSRFMNITTNQQTINAGVGVVWSGQAVILPAKTYVDLIFAYTATGVITIYVEEIATFNLVLLNSKLGTDSLKLLSAIAPSPGAAIINKPMGFVSIAVGGFSVIVTNNLVTASSYVQAVKQSIDPALVSAVVPSPGFFTIYLSAAASATVNLAFFVINPA